MANFNLRSGPLSGVAVAAVAGTVALLATGCVTEPREVANPTLAGPPQQIAAADGLTNIQFSGSSPFGDYLAGLVAGKQRDLAAAADLMYRALESDPENKTLLRQAFILMAADVAAMAPQTNIGSATPIMLGGGETDEVLGRKIENDAAAYVRALAEGHGRNPDLAEEAVREATNVTATEALDANLIDVVAQSQEELLAELDGFAVQGPKAQVLDTEGLVIEERDMPLQFQLLQLIVNPTVAFLLLSAGLLGIAIEVFGGGGLIFPGVLGAIAFLLGMYGTALLPVTIVGIVLLLAGLSLIIAEVHLPTGGVLGISGVVALVASGLLLYNTDSDEFGISAPVVIVVGVLLGGMIFFAVQRVVAAHRRGVLTGWEEMVGAVGDVRVALDPIGQVFAEGALWRAERADEGPPIEPGYTVQVESIEGLTLRVHLVEDAEDPAASKPTTVDKVQEGVR